MQMRNLECFRAVAEELHFTRAAKRLHLSQPPLSRHIKELENELGVVLFRRDRRNVALTDAGIAYAQRVQSILAQLDQAREEARRIYHGETGTLVIAFVSALTYEFLPGILRRFRTANRDVHLVLHDMVPSEQIDALAAGRIDISFAGILPQDCGPDINHRILRQDRMVAAIPSGHALAAGKAIPLRALADEPWILIEKAVSPAYERFIRKLCAKAGFVPLIEHETKRAQAMLGLVAAGLGVTIVPEAISVLPFPDIVYRPLIESPIYEHVVLWRAKEESALVKHFLNSLSKSLPSIKRRQAAVR
jgi:DNA-binding transcriptional LysR family regulator